MAVQRAPESALSLLMVSACWNPFGKGREGEGSCTPWIQSTKSMGGFYVSHRMAFTSPGELCKGLIRCSHGDGPPVMGFNASGPLFKARCWSSPFQQTWHLLSEFILSCFKFCSLYQCLDFSHPSALPYLCPCWLWDSLKDEREHLISVVVKRHAVSSEERSFNAVNCHSTSCRLCQTCYWLQSTG